MSKLSRFLEEQIVKYESTIEYCEAKIMAGTDKRKEYQDVIDHVKLCIEINKTNLATIAIMENKS